jgi:hypothetical protein
MAQAWTEGGWPSVRSHMPSYVSALLASLCPSDRGSSTTPAAPVALPTYLGGSVRHHSGRGRHWLHTLHVIGKSLEPLPSVKA